MTRLPCAVCGEREEQIKMDNETALRGWCAIENYLMMSRKTIISHGYPVRKMGQTGSVFAYPSELNEYQRALAVQLVSQTPSMHAH